MEECPRPARVAGSWRGPSAGPGSRGTRGGTRARAATGRRSAPPRRRPSTRRWPRSGAGCVEVVASPRQPGHLTHRPDLLPYYSASISPRQSTARLRWTRSRPGRGSDSNGYCWRDCASDHPAGMWRRQATLRRARPRLLKPRTNLPTVAYAADAAPGMMKMASTLIDSHSEAGGEPEAADPTELRGRPTVWPGCRYVLGIVAPGCLGEHTEQNLSLATSPAAGLRWSVGVGRSGGRRSLCPHSKSATTEARSPPRERCYPRPCLWGRVLCRADRPNPAGWIFGAVSVYIPGPSRRKPSAMRLTHGAGPVRGGRSR